jgi:arabinose-5-phosphate isomerase
MGMAIVQGPGGRVAGIFTDGDLRRAVERGTDFRATRVDSVMTREPRAIGPERLAIECVERMESLPRVMQLLVVDADGQLVGALHMHDLFRARVQ